MEIAATKTNSDGGNQYTVETVLENVGKSSSLTDASGVSISNGGASNDTQESIVATTSSREAIVGRNLENVVAPGKLLSQQSLVTSADSINLETAVGSATENGLAMEPPTKRMKTSDISPESCDPVVSNTAVVAADMKAAASSVSFSAPITSIVNTNNNHAPSFTSTTQLLLPDYSVVRQTVQDLLGLLQLYGPLTANQLEYNLPPVISTSVPWSVHDVLSILVAIGLVQHVKGSTDQYCIFGGVPRATAVYPTEIPFEIQRAVNEAEDSYKRCQILREALRQTNTTANDNQNGNKNYVDVLKLLLQEYPNITNDPVYWTALRNCHIDMGNGAPHLTPSERRSSTASKSNRGTSSAATGKDGSKASKASKVATTDVSGNKIIVAEKKVVITNPSSKLAQKSSATTDSEQPQKATSIVGSSSTTLTAGTYANNDSSKLAEASLVEKIVETKITPPPTKEATVTITLGTSGTDDLRPQAAVTEASNDDTVTATEQV